MQPPSFFIRWIGEALAVEGGGVWAWSSEVIADIADPEGVNSTIPCWFGDK